MASVTAGGHRQSGRVAPSGGVTAPGAHGGCLPQPRWAVCTTGAGAHRGQTSREGEKDMWWTSAWRNRAPGPHRNAARQAMDGLWTEVCGQQNQSNDPRNNQHNPQYANYWGPLTRKRHIPPPPAQPRHTNDWAPRTRNRHQQEHRPQRPTERSDPTQHAKGRTGDCPGPRKETTTRRNVTRGGGGLTVCRVPRVPGGGGGARSGARAPCAAALRCDRRGKPDEAAKKTGDRAAGERLRNPAFDEEEDAEEPHPEWYDRGHPRSRPFPRRCGPRVTAVCVPHGCVTPAVRRRRRGGGGGTPPSPSPSDV